MITLYQGDCLKEMGKISVGSVDMILTDPPYGTTSCKWDAIIPLTFMWQFLQRVIKPTGAIVMTASQPFTSILVSSNLKQFRHEWIYKKRCASNFAQAKYAPMKEHESVLVFGVKTPQYFPIKEERVGAGAARVKHEFSEATRHRSGEFVGGMKGEFNPKSDELRYPSSVREYNNRAKGQRGLHPTQKPVALMEYLIRTYTQEGDTVLDFAMGSGTTGEACLNLNRNFIGIENDQKYFDIAKERLGL